MSLVPVLISHLSHAFPSRHLPMETRCPELGADSDYIRTCSKGLTKKLGSDPRPSRLSLLKRVISLLLPE